MPKGVTGKISFLEPTEEATKAGFASIHHLLKLANDALAGAGFSAWVVLDRLDVAFTDNDVLEQNALRGLFRVYLDLLGFSHIRLKIFLRTDIWRHLTEATFREASHITSHMTIDWSRNSLLNLIVRRAICNRALMKYYGVYRKQVLASTNAVTQTVGWRIWGMAADGG
jgi:hypothetical protein